MPPFIVPHPGGFDSSRVPIPENLPSKAKKVLMPGISPGGGGGGWAHLELTDTLRRDCSGIKISNSVQEFYENHFTRKSAISELVRGEHKQLSRGPLT